MVQLSAERAQRVQRHHNEPAPNPSAWSWEALSGDLAYIIDERETDSKLTDEEVVADPPLSELALRLVLDLTDFNRASQNGFLCAMVEAVQDRGYLTVPQARGVLNTVSGNVRGRRRYYRSRFTRRDRDEGRGNCLACGAPLEDDLALCRGLGPTCYERALGVWS